MKAILEYLLERGTEPSSYAGLAALFALVDLQVDNHTVSLVADILSGICALGAYLLKETDKK